MTTPEEKEALKLRNKLRRIRGKQSQYRLRIEEMTAKYNGWIDELDEDAIALKVKLAELPHIKNKAERRADRQAKAKEQQNR